VSEAGIPEVKWNEQGLAPAICQDAATGQVLTLAWVNEESLRLTLEKGTVHFWSRSRRKLWKKGETSGNTLTLVDLAADCDGDTLLVRAMPAGPTCHTAARTCFTAPSDGDAPQGFGDLEPLWKTITGRLETGQPGPHTARRMTLTALWLSRGRSTTRRIQRPK